MRYYKIEEIAKKVYREPDFKFKKLMAIGKTAAARGFFTKSEFLSICRWKSCRRIALCERNSAASIERQSAKAFCANNECDRIKHLLILEGVAIPTASALLACFDPSQFGVIDIRAWQLLHSVQAVSKNKKGINLSVSNWLTFIDVIRNVAAQIKSTPRLVEISLYLDHKSSQTKPLYAPFNGESEKLSIRRSRCKNF